MSTQYFLFEGDRRALQILADHDDAGISAERFASLLWGGEYKPGTKGFLARLRRGGLVKVDPSDPSLYRLTRDGRESLREANSRQSPNRILMPIEVLLATYTDGDEVGWQVEFDALWATEPERMDSLTNDIQANGIREPVLIGSDGRIWDGHHRLAVAQTLSIAVPISFAQHKHL